MACDGSGAPRRRRRWSAAEKRRMVDEVLRGGLRVAEVARQNGVHPSVLGRWCRAWRGEVVAAPMLVPVAVDQGERKDGPGRKTGRPLSRSMTIEVALRNGRRLAVPADIAPSLLRRLVAAVEGA